MTDKNCLLTESQYLPAIQWFVQAHSYPCININGQEKFVKSTNRNRCHIAGANGIIRLSIPLAKGREQKALTMEVQIDNTSNWQKVHWQSILSAYGKAPFFIYYRDAFEKAFQQKPHFLIDWNNTLLRACYSALSLHKEILMTADTPTEIITGPLTIHLPPYQQVFRERLGFLPNLSVIDLLFNLGPDAALYIQKASFPSIQNNPGVK